MRKALAASRLLSMSQAQFALGLSTASGRSPAPGLRKYNRHHSSNIFVRTHASSAGSQPASEPRDLSTVLQRVRQGIRGNNPLEKAANKNAMASGMGRHMGCEVGWTFIWRPDGAFYEEIRSRHLTYKWGFDGGADSPVWEVDPSGVSKILQCDDREATLLAALIKSGNWLLPEVADKWLEMELEDAVDVKRSSLVKQYQPEVSMPPVATLVSHTGIVAAAAAGQQQSAAAAAAKPDFSRPVLTEATSINQQQQQQQQQQWRQDGIRMARQSASSNHTRQHCQQPAAAAATAAGRRVIAAASLDSADSWEQDSGPRFCQQDISIIQGIADSLNMKVFSIPQNAEINNNENHNDSENASNNSVDTDQIVGQMSRDKAGGIRGLGGLLLQQVKEKDSVEDSTQQQQQQIGPPFDRVFVAMKLKGGRLITRLSIDMLNGQVVGYSQPLCSDSEKWKFDRWINWTKSPSSSSNDGSSTGSSHLQGNSPDVYFPHLIVHQLHHDQSHHYETHAVVVQGADIHRAYQMPASPRVPIDAQYLQRYSERIPIWQTPGGHILAECHINGKKAGWMVLDTGASGMVIEPAVAEQYGLPKFGTLNIAGVAGKVGTRFRRVAQLRIGPLLLSDPVMMEMKVSKLVSGFHDRIVGIAGFDVFRRCRMTLPCHRTRMDLIKAVGQSGRVEPWTEGTMPIPADRDSDLKLTPSQRWWELNQYQMAQQNAAAVAHAAEGGHSAAPRMAGQAVVSATAVQQQKPTGRRRRKASSSTTALQAVAGTSVTDPAVDVQEQPVQLLLDPQQQQQRDVGVLARVPPVPRKYFFWQHLLVEMLLQRPDAKGADEGYIWQKVVMIASLPHVELEFVVPATGQRHRSLFMLDTGAGGTEMMFHSRAAKELKLLERGKKQGCRTVTGVAAGGVFVQQGNLPEVVIHGQSGSHPNATGSLVMTDVTALFSRVGGLDISLYAAGMICVGFLHRTQTVVDYTNKRIGWRIPPEEHLEDVE